MEAAMSEALLNRFAITADDLSALKKCGQKLGEAAIERVVDKFYEWLPQQPEFNMFFSSKELLEHVKKQQKVYWIDFFKRVVDQRYVDYRIHIERFDLSRYPTLSLDPAPVIAFKVVQRFGKVQDDASCTVLPCRP